MLITIFGASGKVGSLITQELLQRGHTVRAFVHSTALPPQPSLEVIHGDINNRSDVEQALRGADAVVSALGSWGTKDKNILSTAMSYIIPAMEAAGIGRIVSLTGNLAAYPGETRSPLTGAQQALAGIAFPKILRDGEDHIAMLAKSGLDYTVVRSPVMTGSAQTSYTLTSQQSLFSLFVPRRAVAHAMANLAEDNQWPKQCPYISRG